jgi:hypothetical protein
MLTFLITFIYLVFTIPVAILGFSVLKINYNSRHSGLSDSNEKMIKERQKIIAFLLVCLVICTFATFYIHFLMVHK